MLRNDNILNPEVLPRLPEYAAIENTFATIAEYMLDTGNPFTEF